MLLIVVTIQSFNPCDTSSDSKMTMTEELPFPRLVVTVVPTALIASKSQEEVSFTCLPWSLSQPVTHREYVILVTTIDASDDSKDDSPRIICETQLRFSEFYKRFTHASSFFLQPASSIFPSRGTFFENYTTNEANVQHRAKEMQLYLTSLLNESRNLIIDFPSLREAFDINEQGQTLLLPIVKQRRQIEDQRKQRRLMVLQEQAEERRKQEAQEKRRWEQAQVLNVTKPESRGSLRFPLSREFQIQPQWFTAGDANICAAKSKCSWFRLVRTDFPRLLPFSDCTYQLCTARGGVPLLEMKERFRMMDYLCDIYYVTASGTRVGALKVHRVFQFGFFEEDYTVTSIGNAVKDRYCCKGPKRNLRLLVNGTAVGRLLQDFFGGGYTLTIVPNMDCLLLVAISCAVARIHAAIDDRRRRRR